MYIWVTCWYLCNYLLLISLTSDFFILTYSLLKYHFDFLISHILFSAWSLYEKILAYQLFPTISVKESYIIIAFLKILFIWPKLSTKIKGMKWNNSERNERVNDNQLILKGYHKKNFKSMSWDNIETNKKGFSVYCEQWSGPDNLQKDVSFIFMKLASMNWNPQIPVFRVFAVNKSCSHALREDLSF